MLNDHLNDVGGIFTIEVIRDGKNGPEVINRVQSHNLIVNTGKKQLWRAAQGLNTSLFKFMRIGTCGVAANSSQTNVVSAITGTIKTATMTLLSGTRTAQWVYSYASGAGSKSATNIKEIVIMNQKTSPGGSALCRSVFTAVNKTTSDKLKITYQSRIT